MIQTSDASEGKAIAEPVRAAFAAMPAGLRARFQTLRDLIFVVAQADARIGPLQESLKWGEPAYRPLSGVGSTVRLAVPRDRPNLCGVFFICSTGLVDGFRATFPEMTYAGNRAILIDPAADIPDGLAACLHRALSYHLKAV